MSAPAPAPRVVLIQTSLPQYRLAFFEALRVRLSETGIELLLIHGQPPRDDALKADSGNLPWAHPIRNRAFTFCGRSLIWQPALLYVRPGDLVIVEQASKLLLNYVLIANHLRGRSRLAFWGHGRDLTSSSPHRCSEAVKRWLSRRVHWWFAYTAASARIVADLGFPSERVTTVQNALDTHDLAVAAATISSSDVRRERDRLGLRSGNVAIYCGALYRAKRLDFLIEAAQIIRTRIPDFELIILGAGPDRHIVERATVVHKWVHYVGPKFGRDKALYFALAKTLLIPGLVGLALVDSFAFATPLIAIDGIRHGPEIEYLETGHNGLLLPVGSNARQYATAAANLLASLDCRIRLMDGCRASRVTYTVENMVDRFARGVEQALASSINTTHRLSARS